jgi:hypothetical protein
MLKRLKIQAEDMLRYNPAVRNLLASAILLKAPSGAGREHRRGCPHHSPAMPGGSSCRLRLDDAQSGGSDRPPTPAIDPEQVPWAEFLSDFGLPRIHKTIVLKRYVSEREKGVVFVSFDNQMARLAKAKDLRQFAEHYTLVLSPQWSPPHSIASLSLPSPLSGPDLLPHQQPARPRNLSANQR